MNTVDLDPCDRYGSLTDRQAVGDRLSPDEAAWVQKHAEGCPVCRTEAALYAALPGVLRTPGRPAIVVTARPRRRRLRALVLLAAALTLGGAAAAELIVMRPFARPAPAVAPAVQPPLPLPIATQVAPAATEEPAPEPTAAPKRSAVDDSVTPDSLLRDARAARSARRDGDAAALYRRLIRQFPSSPQAVPARVSLGDIQLSLGDASGALASFDAYLDSGQTVLTREARYGRIRALGALGRSADERREIELFLRDYPSSPQAPALSAKLAPR